MLHYGIITEDCVPFKYQQWQQRVVYFIPEVKTTWKSLCSYLRNFQARTEINAHFKHKHTAWTTFLPNFFLNLITIIRADSPNINLNGYCICILSVYVYTHTHTYIHMCMHSEEGSALHIMRPMLYREDGCSEHIMSSSS